MLLTGLPSRMERLLIPCRANQSLTREVALYKGPRHSLGLYFLALLFH